MGMDIIDRKLLELLQEDATMPIAELAQRVNLSQTPCWKRLQRLKETGVIRGQVALCDARKLGVGTTVFVAVRDESAHAGVGADFHAGGAGHSRSGRGVPDERGDGFTCCAWWFPTSTTTTACTSC